MSLIARTPPPPEIATASGQRQRHWLGLPVSPSTEGTFDEVLSVLPHFGRQPFVMASQNGGDLGINSYLDMVYRVPVRQSERPVPVGVVSKNYRLLDHHQILRTIQQSMANRKLDLENVRVVAEWTIHGERAHFSIIFPPEEHFTVGTVGNEDEMRFRIEVFNSVDGSCRLMAIAGWLRFVCTNGLINAQISATPFDFAFVFGETTGVDGDSLLVEQTVRVTMSPQHAKIFSQILANQVGQYEENFGPIVTPQVIETKTKVV